MLFIKNNNQVDDRAVSPHLGDKLSDSHPQRFEEVTLV